MLTSFLGMVAKVVWEDYGVQMLSSKKGWSKGMKGSRS